ncbi:unnamed protein product, partial [Rotaria sordida]
MPPPALSIMDKLQFR